MKSWLILSLLLFQLPHLTGQDQADRIHRLMEAYCGNGVFNGAVLVSQKGKVIYKGAFDAALKETILDPAGMFQSGQFKNDPIEKKMVAGYEYKLLHGYDNAVMFDHSCTVGPGGVISTVEDLYRWDRALYSNNLLGSELTARMFTPHRSGRYGYGWFINKRKIGGEGDSIMMADHAGSINGFGAWMARILSDMQQFPQSYNACDSYAYALMQMGDYGNAVKYYKQGLAVLQEYPEYNDQDAVKADAEKALVYIREMEEKSCPAECTIHA